MVDNGEFPEIEVLNLKDDYIIIKQTWDNETNDLVISKSAIRSLIGILDEIKG